MAGAWYCRLHRPRARASQKPSRLGDWGCYTDRSGEFVAPLAGGEKSTQRLDTFSGALGSDVTMFSFCANKTITTDEGDMAGTRDATLAKRIKTTRLHGMSRDSFRRLVSLPVCPRMTLADVERVAQTSRMALQR